MLHFLYFIVNWCQVPYRTSSVQNVSPNLKFQHEWSNFDPVACHYIPPSQKSDCRAIYIVGFNNWLDHNPLSSLSRRQERATFQVPRPVKAYRQSVWWSDQWRAAALPSLLVRYQGWTELPVPGGLLLHLLCCSLSCHHLRGSAGYDSWFF